MDFVQFLETSVYPRLDIPHVLSDLHPEDHGKHYCLECPSCRRPEAFLYKGSSVICCNRKTRCGATTSLVGFFADDPWPRGAKFLEAARKLARLAGVDIPRVDGGSHGALAQQNRIAMLNVVFRACADHLWSSAGAEARSYLENERGLQPDDLRNLSVGLFPESKDMYRALCEAGFEDDEIVESKVVSRKMEGYAVFPWRDSLGQPLTLYGRFPGKDLPERLALAGWRRSRDQKREQFEKTSANSRSTSWVEPRIPKTFALPGEGSKRSPLFLDRALHAGHVEVVLVEGVLDAAVLQARGETNVIACVGSRLSQGQVETLARRRIQSVTICLDPDKAGVDGVNSCLRSLEASGIDALVAPTLPDNLDPDEFVLRFGVDRWREHIGQGVHGYRYAARRIFTRHEVSCVATELRASKIIDDATLFAEARTEAMQKLKLQNYFWPEIASALGMQMDDVLSAIRARPGQGDHEIVSPIPLRRELPPAPLYPVDALGEALAPAARKLAEVIQAPPAMCAQSILAAATLAIQGHRNVVVDGRQMPLSEFFLTVGLSGERKSAVDRVSLHSHHEHERRLYQNYRDSKRQHEDDCETWEAARKDAMKKKGVQRDAALMEAGLPPQPPILPNLIAEEPTYEGLIKLLENGQPSIGVFADEGGRMIGGHGMSPEQQLKTAAGLCELWDGKRVSRVRAGDGASLLYGRRVSMHLMAQPMVAQQLLSNALMIEQGLMSRCLVSYPDSTAGKRLYRSADLTSDEVMLKYHQRIRDLLTRKLPLSLDAEKGNELDPRPMPVSEEAKTIWVAFHDEVERKLGPEGEYESIRGFANKAPEHALRIAATLTLVENIDAEDVPADKLTSGTEIVRYHLTEALRLFHAADDPDLELAERLRLWSFGFEHVYLQKIYQRGPNRIRSKKVALRVAKVLEDHGWYVQVPGGMELDGAKRKIVWKVQREVQS